MDANCMDLEDKNIFISTVTKFFTGHVAKETKKYFKLDKAAWIADTGRFTEAMAKAEFSEVEPYNQPVFVMKAAIVDVCEIGALPTTQK